MPNLQFSLLYTDATAPEAMFELADRAIQQGARSLLLLAADANECTPEQFDPWLTGCPVPVFGGVFPQLIHDSRNRETGFLVAALSEPVEIFHLKGLSDPEPDFYSELDTLVARNPDPAAIMVLVDGLASGISGLLDAVYDVLGSRPTYFGGGAGSLSFAQKPCLFSNQGMLSDHGQLIVLPSRFSLGVEHGWEKFAGPFVATSSRRTVVESLDFQPAFQVYRSHVEADSQLTFDDQNFFDIAKGYPFGMEKPDGSIVVRDPITRDGDSMVCVGEVPINSVLYLLKGKPSNLVGAAVKGAARLPKGEGTAILTDCISRVLYLGDAFVEELEAVQAEAAPRQVFGMLTLGEIANGEDYCLEFYNKTLVIAAPQS